MAEHGKTEFGVASHDEDEILAESPVLQASFCCCSSGKVLAIHWRKEMGGCNVVEGLKEESEVDGIDLEGGKLRRRQPLRRQLRVNEYFK